MMFRWDPKKTRGNYRVFSGVDIVPVGYSAGRLMILGNVQTISVSIHKDFAPVRSFGYSDAKWYVGANRTYAGTMVFVDFDYGSLSELSGLWQQDRLVDSRMRAIHLSSLPPFDIILTYQNEYGSLSYMRIFGIFVPDEGMVCSVNQLFGETTVQYIALGVDRLTPVYEHGRTALFQDSIFYGRYDLNTMRTGGGEYISELLGHIRKLQAAKVSILHDMPSADSDRFDKGCSLLNNIEEKIRYAQDAMDRYGDIDMSQALQMDPYLNRIIDTGIQVFHEKGELIDFNVDAIKRAGIDKLIKGSELDKKDIQGLREPLEGKDKSREEIKKFKGVDSTHKEKEKLPLPEGNESMDALQGSFVPEAPDATFVYESAPARPHDDVTSDSLGAKLTDSMDSLSSVISGVITANPDALYVTTAMGSEVGGLIRDICDANVILSELISRDETVAGWRSYELRRLNELTAQTKKLPVRISILKEMQDILREKKNRVE